MLKYIYAGVFSVLEYHGWIRQIYFNVVWFKKKSILVEKKIILGLKKLQNCCLLVSTLIAAILEFKVALNVEKPHRKQEGRLT